MKMIILIISIFQLDILNGATPDNDDLMVSYWQEQRALLTPEIIQSFWVNDNDAWKTLTTDYLRYDLYLTYYEVREPDLGWVRHISLFPSDLLIRLLERNGIHLNSNSVFAGKSYWIENADDPPVTRGDDEFPSFNLTTGAVENE